MKFKALLVLAIALSSFAPPPLIFGKPHGQAAEIHLKQR